jgi:hypothetical protein
MAIFEIKSDQIVRVEETTFDEAGLRERYDLQRLLRRQIDVIAPGTLIITEEFGEWDECKRRIDLLGLDKDANLVVIELKRTEDGGHMELQAIRYAAMVSTMTFEKVVELYGRFLSKLGSGDDPQASILTFLGWDEPDEDRFAHDVRIVLVSADFSKELTTAVMWLNERDLDIRCIRIKPYKDNGRVLVDVQQVIPLPEVAEYQVQIREKEHKVRQERSSERHVLRKKFWEGLLSRALKKTDLHADISPTEYNWIGSTAGMRGLGYQYHLRKDGGSVMLYIDRGTDHAELNKKLFDVLYASHDEIDRAFGTPLVWDRSNETQASFVKYDMSLGGWRDDQAKWPTIQDEMIDAMIRLDRALSPHIVKLKGVPQ